MIFRSGFALHQTSPSPRLSLLFPLSVIRPRALKLKARTYSLPRDFPRNHRDALRTMLAAPLHPASSFSPLQPGEETQLKPAKDLDAFNALLPPPIEFVEGSSTGPMFDETKYTPINASPRSKNEVRPQFACYSGHLVPSCVDKLCEKLTTSL